jgi:glycosyltransferase involved in cell wall biosynthesis
VKLSVLIPVYNEERTLEEVVRRVRCIELPKEIILVDDGSKDRSREILMQLQKESERAPDPLNEIRIFLQSNNQGKGAAIKVALDHARGDVISSMTHTIIRRCWNPSSEVLPTWFMERDSLEAARTASCSSGTRWAIGCSH